MSAPRCWRCLTEGSLPRSLKRTKFTPQVQIQARSASSTQAGSSASQKSTDQSKTQADKQAATKDASTKPLPPNVIAAYRTPVRLEAPHGIRVAQVQMRSYSVRSLEFFADFAMRVAQYLKLPASGPVPLPKRIERWTVIRSNFAHKKSQENFERITMKRLITIKDGDKRAVEAWLACLRKWQFYGVGMKANVWDWEGLDVLDKMDKDAEEIRSQLDAELANFGWNSNVAEKKSIKEMLLKQGVKHAGVGMTEVRGEIKDAKNVYLE